MKRNGCLFRFILVILLIEFMDELVYGVREAAWPLIRADLKLSYVEIGLLISLPGIIGGVVEPALGILADTWKRRVLILGGGCIYFATSLLAAASHSFWPLLAAYVFGYPASGAFVGLSEAVLMDLEPDRHEQNMARWTFAGSLGTVIGPLLIGGSALAGWGWRAPFWAVAGLVGIVLVLSWQPYRRHIGPRHSQESDAWESVSARMSDGGAEAAGQEADIQGDAAQEAADQVAGREKISFWQGLRNAGKALKRKEVLRWLILLQFSDLMLDVLFSYLALYMVDVAGMAPATASLAVAIWTGVGLLGDFLLIPLIERVPGVFYLRISTTIEMILFPAFLLAPWLPVKLALLGLLGLFNSGSYAILQGRLYSTMPGQSGTVITLNDAAGLVGKLIPVGIGLAAQQFGLGMAIWLLLAGPVALLIGLPREKRGTIAEPEA